jgi:hypothetical protein
MSQIIDFYKNRCPNTSGYYITSVWSMAFTDYEFKHDYIQWLFPLDVGSDYNPDAPILTPEDIELFKSNNDIDDDFNLDYGLFSSFLSMLSFYGLRLAFAGKHNLVVVGEDFNNRYDEWLNPRNHNYLRITRILKSLVLLGQEKYAKAFLKCLKELYELFPERIGEETLAYWCESVPDKD